MDKLKPYLSFLKSTGLVVFLSFLGAFGSGLLSVNHFQNIFWGVFFLLFCLQYIIFTFLGSMYKNYITQRTRQKELDVLEPLSTLLECAYCSSTNLMTFFPNQNERKEFVCTSCDKKNVVNMQFSVARITEPVVVKNATGVPSIQTTPDE